MNARPRCSSLASTQLPQAGVVLVLGILTATVASRAAADVDTRANTIRFKTRVSNDRGVVRCGIFREGGWLKSPLRSVKVEIRGKLAWCIFNGLPAGTYGISGFHDENVNGKLDTNFIGYPSEEYCASRNARNAFRAPSFSGAKFRYGGGTLELEAVMK